MSLWCECVNITGPIWQGSCVAVGQSCEHVGAVAYSPLIAWPIIFGLIGFAIGGYWGIHKVKGDNHEKNS